MSQLFSSGGRSFSSSPSSEFSGLISFRIDWLDLLAVQETFNSLLQHHNSKASSLWYSAFFMLQLSHPHMTPGKIMCLCSCSVVSDSVIPWTVACQAHLSMEFYRHEYWSGLPFPTPEHLLDPGTEPVSLHFLSWQAESLSLCHLER